MTAHDSSVIEATRPTSQGSPSFSRDSASLFLIRSAASLLYPKHHIVHLQNSERKKPNKQNTCRIPSILYMFFVHVYLKDISKNISTKKRWQKMHQKRHFRDGFLNRSGKLVSLQVKLYARYLSRRHPKELEHPSPGGRD